MGKPVPDIRIIKPEHGMVICSWFDARQGTSTRIALCPPCEDDLAIKLIKQARKS